VFTFYYCRLQKFRKEIGVVLESPSASLKWLRELYWNPSNQKSYLEEEGKTKILLLAIK